MVKDSTNNSVTQALAAMVQPSHGRTTRTVPYWATAVGMSAPSLYAKCDGERPLTVTELIAISRATGDTLALEAVSRECGGIFLSTPQCELPASVPLFQQMADTARQQSETLAVICEAVRDCYVTADERAQIDAEIVNMMASMSKLRGMVHELPSKPVQNVTPIRRDVM